MTDIVIEVSARTFHVPLECACCGGSADTQRSASSTRRTGKRVIRETTRSLPFPYCQTCDAHVRTWDSASAITALVVIVGTGLAIGVGITTNNGAIGAAIVGVAAVLAIVANVRIKSNARAQCQSTCACPQTSVAFLGWSGTINSFQFFSSTYAAKFGHGNARKLINVGPDLARLLQQSTSQSPPIQSRTPTPSPRSSRASVLDWINRLESYKGSVARRNALERALQEIHDPMERQQLLAAASKIEVRTVLDKVDGLKSVAAKRRHLQMAAEKIKLDNIPDELQAAELQILEQRLRSLQ